MKNNNKNLDNDENRSLKTKKNRKKVVSSIFMFTGLVSSLLTITTVAIYFSSKKTKKSQFIIDKKNETKVQENLLSENEKEYQINLEKQINALDFFDLSSPIEINKTIHDFGTNISLKYSFYKTGYNFEQKFERKNPYIGELLETDNKKNVLNIDLLKEFNDFNSELKTPLNFQYFIQQIASIKIPIAYFFKQDGKSYFLNSKPGISGYEIKEFFSKIHSIIKKHKNIKIVEPKKFILSVFATTNLGKIENLHFQIDCKFKINDKN